MKTGLGNLAGVYNYSLNGGNLRGTIVTVNGKRVFSMERRVKVGGFSERVEISADNILFRSKIEQLGIKIGRHIDIDG